MYLNDDGSFNNSMLSTFGYLSSGVPGTVAGLWEVHQKFGSLPWKNLIEDAIFYAENGFDIVIHYSESKNEAEELVAKLKSFGIAAFCIKANLLKDNEITTLIEETTQTTGKPINLLVNNASIFENDSLLSLTLESWDRHFFTNLKAPVFLAKEFSKQVPDHFKDENNEIGKIEWELNPTYLGAVSYTHLTLPTNREV